METTIITAIAMVVSFTLGYLLCYVFGRKFHPKRFAAKYITEVKQVVEQRPQIVKKVVNVITPNVKRDPNAPKRQIKILDMRPLVEARLNGVKEPEGEQYTEEKV